MMENGDQASNRCGIDGWCGIDPETIPKDLLEIGCYSHHPKLEFQYLVYHTNMQTILWFFSRISDFAIKFTGGHVFLSWL